MNLLDNYPIESVWKSKARIQQLESCSISLPPSLPRFCSPEYLIGRCVQFLFRYTCIHCTAVISYFINLFYYCMCIHVLELY